MALLGPFQATLDEKPIAQFRTKTVQALLIYLMCEADRPHQREQLMTLLWPGMPQESAQANMRQTLYRLRKLIPEVKGRNGDVVPFLVTDRQTIQINPDADYFLDVAVFASSAPAQAIALYRGDFLADFYLPDSEAFEEWVTSRRADYRRRVLEMMAEETAVHLQKAAYDRAIQLAQRQIEIDNLRESSHRQLMEAWARKGRRREALSHYDTLRQLLQDELAIEPSQETRTLIKAIRADAFASPNPATPFGKEEPETTNHNLPQRLTSFIGREKEIVAITDLITQNRLVTLTGVGGIGKTNLCLQVGQNLLDTFPDGVWFIELAPVADPALVAQTAAHTLGLRSVSDVPILEVMLNNLRGKTCLLILDNCEHVIEAAAQLAQTVLQACPGVTILATSRESLSIPGEMMFQVPSLTVPIDKQQVTTENWQAYEAIRLFVERATAVLPHFQVRPENIAVLVQICQQLDGIPLALELAAARMKVLTTEQIAKRLDDRFRFLTRGNRTALPRQQTLRALIDWSWELLEPDEQQLFQRLSVFAGGMTLEAVEAVCADEALAVHDILDLLSELVNKSLVVARREPGQETRYRLLETVRHYAQEKLVQAGQTATFRQRHLAYFMGLGQQAELALVGPDQAAWIKRLEGEVDNIRAALSWSQSTDPEAGLTLVNNLHRFWLHGYINDGLFWLNHLLSDPDSIALTIKAKALWVQGQLAYQTADSELALALIEESLALYQHLEDGTGIARCLLQLGIIHYWRVNEAKGRILVENCLQLCRTLDAPLLTAEALEQLGFFAARAGAWSQMTAYMEEAEALYRKLGHVVGLVGLLAQVGLYEVWHGDFERAQSLLTEVLTSNQQIWDFFPYYALGRYHYWQGEYDEAQPYFEKFLMVSREIGNKRFAYWALIGLGYIRLRQNNLAEAQANFTECLQMLAKMELAIGLGFAYLFEGFAVLALRRHEAHRAIHLFAAADKLWQPPHSPRRPLDQRDKDRDIALLQTMVDEETFSKVYEAGQLMSREQILAYLLEDEGQAEL